MLEGGEESVEFGEMDAVLCFQVFYLSDAGRKGTLEVTARYDNRQLTQIAEVQTPNGDTLCASIHPVLRLRSLQ